MRIVASGDEAVARFFQETFGLEEIKDLADRLDELAALTLMGKSWPVVPWYSIGGQFFASKGRYTNTVGVTVTCRGG